MASDIACPLVRGLFMVFGWSNGRSTMTTAPPRNRCDQNARSGRVILPFIAKPSHGRAFAPLRLPRSYAAGLTRSKSFSSWQFSLHF